MKCAIYARVSTAEQETSIVNQQEYFKDYIIRHNLEIYDIYSDEAFSGTETTKRLSFQRLLEDGKNKKYDVLLAKSYSRFGRNQRETLTALALLFEHGIRIIFVEDGLDSLRDKGQFGLFAWLAEQESRKMSERIKMTWQVYNKEGKIHSLTETYGYNFDSSSRNFIVNEKEAEVVRMIFDMYLRGDGVKKIAIFLNSKKFPAKRGGNWHATNINNMIRNEFYIGHLIQGKVRNIDVTIKKREYVDKKDWFVHKNNHEAIISEKIFGMAQEEHKKRSEYLKELGATRHSTVHLFSNLIKCKLCGGSCIARKVSSKVAETCYSCKSYEAWGRELCGHKRNAITEKTLLLNVKTALEMLAENGFKVVKDYYTQNQADKIRHKKKQNLATLNEQIEKQTSLANSLLGVLSEGIITKEQYKIQNDSISAKLESLIQQREEALDKQSRRMANPDDEGETISSIKHLLETDVTLWSNEMMKKVINRVYLNMLNEEVEIVYNYTISSH